MLILKILLLLLICVGSDEKPRNYENIYKKSVNFQTLDIILKSINFDVYQTVIITDKGERQQNGVLFLVRKIQQNLPTLQSSTLYFHDDKIEDFFTFETVLNFRDSTLFLIINDEKNFTRIEKSMKQIAILARSKNRPRCLIIRFSNAIDDEEEKFLREMWKTEYFLDVAIINISDVNRIRIHQLNPFISYQNVKFTKESILFPDKLLNMKRYPMKVGIFNLPPLTYVKRNSTHHPIETFGKDSYTGNIISQRMNFRPIFVATRTDNFGKFSYNKSKATGLIYKLLNGQVQYICVTSLTSYYSYSRDKKKIDYIIELAKADYEQLVVLVPKLDDSTSVSLEVGVYYSILIIVVIMLINWILQRFLKLDRTIFNYFTIIEILLGMSIRNEPKDLHVRIIFMTMILMAFFFSSEIFALLTSVQVTSNNGFKINSFKDLNKSDLDIGTQINTLLLIESTEDHDIIAMVTKKRKIFPSYELCLKRLIERKNVACVMKQTIAEWYLLKYNKKGQEIMKIIPENFYTTLQVFSLEPGSPYRQKFELLLLLMREAGLSERWKVKLVDYFKSEIKIVDLETNDENEILHLKKMMIYIISIGLGLSIIVFLGELSSGMIKKVFFNQKKILNYYTEKMYS